MKNFQIIKIKFNTIKQIMRKILTSLLLAGTIALITPPSLSNSELRETDPCKVKEGWACYNPSPFRNIKLINYFFQNPEVAVSKSNLFKNECTVRTLRDNGYNNVEDRLNILNEEDCRNVKLWLGQFNPEHQYRTKKLY